MLCVKVGTKYCYPIKNAHKVSDEAKATNQFFDDSVIVLKFDNTMSCYAENEIIDIDLTNEKPIIGKSLYRINKEYKYHFEEV